jgi:hypothetical protein
MHISIFHFFRFISLQLSDEGVTIIFSPTLLRQSDLKSIWSYGMVQTWSVPTLELSCIRPRFSVEQFDATIVLAQNATQGYIPQERRNKNQTCNPLESCLLAALRPGVR